MCGAMDYRRDKKDTSRSVKLEKEVKEEGRGGRRGKGGYSWNLCVKLDESISLRGFQC